MGESRGLGCQGPTRGVRTLQGLPSDATESQLRVSSHGGDETGARALSMHPPRQLAGGLGRQSCQPTLSLEQCVPSKWGVCI